MRSILLAATGLCLCGSLYNPGQARQLLQKGSEQQISWLAGTWENKTGKGSLYETWTKVNDTLYQGKSYMLQQKDTVVVETIQLIKRGASLYYIPTVARQNKGEAVAFKLLSAAAGQLVFENPEHDFPQRITYTQMGPDSLVASISGKRNGREQSRQFPMKRCK